MTSNKNKLMIKVACVGEHNMLLNDVTICSGANMITNDISAILNKVCKEPHNTSTSASMTGNKVKDGCLKDVNNGILLLDQANEFSSRVLQVIEDVKSRGKVKVDSVDSVNSVEYDTSFQLIMAVHKLGGKPSKIEKLRNLNRIPLVLIDRCDINIKFDEKYTSLLDDEIKIAKSEVDDARKIMRDTLINTLWANWSEVSGAFIRKNYIKDNNIVAYIHELVDSAKLSLRQTDKLCRLSMSVANLIGRDCPLLDDVKIALNFVG